MLSVRVDRRDEQAAVRKTVALPADDVFTAVLDEEAASLAAQRPGDAFGHLESTLDRPGRIHMVVDAFDELFLVRGAAPERRIPGRWCRCRRVRRGERERPRPRTGGRAVVGADVPVVDAGVREVLRQIE